MKYISKIKVVLSTVVLCVFCSSCADWLDVQQKDNVLDDQVYSSELRIKDALNGIYLTMGKQALYGQNLTCYTSEILAQRYNLQPGTSTADNLERFHLSSWNYHNEGWAGYKTFKSHVDNIYFSGYNLILDVNFFIKRLSATKNVVIDSRKELMLGEAYAIRAYMHFDLLRLFGPVYKLNPEGISIPYCTEPTSEWQERQRNSVVLSKVLADIETALELLKNDPIITNGVLMGDDSDDSKSSFFYTDYRNRRMNYYAVQALKARVLMYRGSDNDRQEAGILAKTLLETLEFNDAFPWTISSDVNALKKQDRIFSKEVIFGIHVSEMYSIWETWFNPGRTASAQILGVMAKKVTYMFENSSSWGLTGDWRAGEGFWTEFPASTSFILTNKFKKTESETEHWYFQPLIRKTELHLIATEVFQDVNYLDEIRIHRGLRTLAESGSSGNLETEIEKEYMKEFIGEGQLWFYYKRINRNSILGYDGTTIRSIQPDQYALPMPEKEVDER